MWKKTFFLWFSLSLLSPFFACCAPDPLQTRPAAASSLDVLDAPIFRHQAKTSRRYFDAYLSPSSKFVYFRIYKAATGTLTHFFNDQVHDLESQRLYSVPDCLKRYFKFAFVRSTWDRILSCYMDKVASKKDPAFSDCFDRDFEFFIDYIDGLDLSNANRHIALQTDLIPYRECDFIGRFERLEEGLAYVCSVLDIPMKEPDHRHPSVHAHYSQYYTERMRKIIARKYRKEIKVFGFKFEKRD